MEVILLEDVEGLGKRGETVKVASGHARNYLLPLKKAVPSGGAGARIFQEEEKRHQATENKMRRAAERLATELAKVSCMVTSRI